MGSKVLVTTTDHAASEERGFITQAPTAAQKNIQKRVFKGKQRRSSKDTAKGFLIWAPRTVAVTVAAAKAACDIGSEVKISVDRAIPMEVQENIRGKKCPPFIPKLMQKVVIRIFTIQMPARNRGV